VRETDSTVSTDQLHQWFRGPGVLLKELQKLKLVPKLAKRRGDNNYYVLDREHIIATAQEYVGEYLFGEPKADATEPDTNRTTESNPDDGDFSLDDFLRDLDASLPTKPQVRMATPEQVAFMVNVLEWDEEVSRNCTYEEACRYLEPCGFH
jgi:hypothetical protein